MKAGFEELLTIYSDLANTWLVEIPFLRKVRLPESECFALFEEAWLPELEARGWTREEFNNELDSRAAP